MLYLCSKLQERMNMTGESNEALKAILRKSHEQAMSGNTFTMDYVERFMHDKVYELKHRMDSYRVAEPV